MPAKDSAPHPLLPCARWRRQQVVEGAHRITAEGTGVEPYTPWPRFEAGGSSPRRDVRRVPSRPFSAQSASCRAGISTAVFRRRLGSRAIRRSPYLCLPGRSPNVLIARLGTEPVPDKIVSPRDSGRGGTPLVEPGRRDGRPRTTVRSMPGTRPAARGEPPLLPQPRFEALSRLPSVLLGEEIRDERGLLP